MAKDQSEIEFHSFIEQGGGLNDVPSYGRAIIQKLVKEIEKADGKVPQEVKARWGIK